MKYANVLFYVADPDAVAATRPVHRSDPSGAVLD